MIAYIIAPQVKVHTLKNNKHSLSMCALTVMSKEIAVDNVNQTV